MGESKTADKFVELMNEWKASDKLVVEIYHFYQKRTNKNRRSGYFDWFLAYYHHPRQRKNIKEKKNAIEGKRTHRPPRPLSRSARLLAPGARRSGELSSFEQSFSVARCQAQPAAVDVPSGSASTPAILLATNCFSGKPIHSSSTDALSPNSRMLKRNGRCSHFSRPRGCP
jgi:hypothetical protein